VSRPRSRAGRALVRAALGAAVAAVAALGAGCAGTSGRYVSVDALPEGRGDAAVYLVSVGDALAVRVWDEDRLSARATVRPDGKISLPLIRDLSVVGLSMEQAADSIAARLRKDEIVLNPRVTVTLESSQPLNIAVIGEVVRPGMYNVASGAGVAEALASAGGPTEFAHRDRIFVLRRTPSPLRIRFTYDALTRAEGKAAWFRLRPGDVVVVE
jgi:polysaccharide biosynthesis/export protein